MAGESEYMNLEVDEVEIPTQRGARPRTFFSHDRLILFEIAGELSMWGISGKVVA